MLPHDLPPLAAWGERQWVSPLRSLFDLALLDGPNYLLIALYVVIWVFLVRWAWRGRILERFLALE